MSSSKALLICSSLSLLSCIVVVASIGSDPTASTSRHQGLLFKQLHSHIGLTTLRILNNKVARSGVSDSVMNQFCNVFLPFPIYFFLCSFGWTILIAFKFRSSKSWFLPTENVYQVPFWVVWIVAFIFIIPSILLDIVRPNLINNAISSSTTNMCVYNHTNTTGIIVDVCTFLLPLTLTILINLYSYTRVRNDARPALLSSRRDNTCMFVCIVVQGLWALRDSPHSVLAKNMRKAGGYLLVLLFVFLPNIIYNYFAISSSSNSKYGNYLDFAFCLSSLQVRPSEWCCFVCSVLTVGMCRDS
jgi:hypothetical protein